jgi:hypothetical protein
MESVSMMKTFYRDGERVELWSTPSSEFSCAPGDLRHYMEIERWDLVFNALCHLAGVVDEGSA